MIWQIFSARQIQIWSKIRFFYKIDWLIWLGFDSWFEIGLPNHLYTAWFFCEMSMSKLLQCAGVKSLSGSFHFLFFGQSDQKTEKIMLFIFYKKIRKMKANFFVFRSLWPIMEKNGMNGTGVNFIEKSDLSWWFEINWRLIFFLDLIVRIRLILIQVHTWRLMLGSFHFSFLIFWSKSPNNKKNQLSYSG